MSPSCAARRFARLVAGLRSARPNPARRARLAVQSLEDRAVPANSIFLADRATDSLNIHVETVGDTTTISTTNASATLSLKTIEDALTADPAVKHVIVTTAVTIIDPEVDADAQEAGDIFWDGAIVGDQLDLTVNGGTGTDKTLTFRTVPNSDPGTPATGLIVLTGVLFDNSATADTISLVFDSSQVGGAVSFGDVLGAPTVLYTSAAVRDLTVDAGAGDFVFYHDGAATAADAAGAVSVTAGLVDVSLPYSMTAGGDLTISATQVTLANGTGLSAGGDLTVTGTDSLSATSATFEAPTGAMTLSGGVVTLTDMILRADGDLTVSGDTSVDLTNQFGEPVESFNGNIAVTGGTVSLPFTDLYTETGGITVSGTDVSGWVSFYCPDGPLAITGTSSVNLTNATADTVAGVTVTGGTVSLNGVAFLLLEGGDATVTGTTVTLNATQVTTEDGSVSIAGTGITLNDSVVGGPGNVTLTGPVTLGGSLNEVVNGLRQGTITFNGPVNGASGLAVDGKTVVFNAPVGATTPLTSLTIRHGNTVLGANSLSAATIDVGKPFDENDFDPTEATLGGTGTVTGDVTVWFRGNLAPGGLGTVGTMTVRGNVTFESPGIFTGPGGDLAIDFGVGQADQLKVVDNPGTLPVEGAVDLSAGARLGGGLGTGQLTTPTATILDSTGLLTGQFSNAPIGTGLLVGMDAITVTQYTRPDGTGEVIVAPLAAVGPVFKGSDDDGTTFTATLTGGGTLVPGKTPAGQWFLVVRNSTPASRLTITTRANASDDVVTLAAGLLVNGPLALMSAPKVNIGDQFRASGAVAVATFRDFLDLNGAGIELGGTAANRTAITARNIQDDVTVGANLTTLRVTQTLGDTFFDPFNPSPKVSAASVGAVTARAAVADIITPGKLGPVTIAREYNGTIRAASIARLQALGGTATLKATGAPGVAATVGAVVSTGPDGMSLDIDAAKVASVSVAGPLSGVFGSSGWDVAGGITTISAGKITGLDVKAGFIGTVTAKGLPIEGISGDIEFATFTVTTNDGTLARNAIRAVTARGTVQAALFDVDAGNVGTVTVGRFLNSQLYLNYNSHDPFAETFDTGGSFGSEGFKLGAFRTTAPPLGDPDHPLNWAFSGSEIAADKLGTVLLSGLDTDNNGLPFGIKVRTTPGSVKVTQADDLSVPRNVNLVPDGTAPYDPIAGDFFFIDV